MNLEQHVCSLELAKRLNELGVKQESYLWWLFWDDHNGEGERAAIVHDRGRADVWEITERDKVGAIVSAFTVAELGEMLPESAKSMKSSQNVADERWLSYCVGHDRIFYADTEADARAKMLIYLIENKLA